MTENQPYKKKLIEVALPLDAINAESAREKSIRHGHPSTLHLWWARRPLAACRAVLFAQLVDDPSAHADRFPTEEAQDHERQRLFGIIERLVKWENSTNEEVLEEARAEIRKSYDGNPPPILDPFAGGGSIPLEAQRLGLEAHASDLNPVAVLINKALIEIPAKWAGQPPVHPDAERRTHWKGAEGLAEDVRRYGRWMRDEAGKRIGHLYPKATLPDGTKAGVIAWIWTRTVRCSNPACGATTPTTSTYWLGQKKGKEAWVEPIVDGRDIRFRVAHGPGGPRQAPKIGRGAKFECVVCGSAVEEPYVRAEGMAGRIGATLMAVVAEGDRRRHYLDPSDDQVEVADVPRPESIPQGEMPDNPRWFSPPAYGMRAYGDLFTPRQLVALTTLGDLVVEVAAKVSSDAAKASLASHEAYAAQVAVYLTFALDRILNESCSLCTWVPSPTKEHVKNAFGRQAVPMTWDFAESNVFGDSTGSFLQSVHRVAEVVQRTPARSGGHAEQRDARDIRDRGVIATDPPYYDNIGYSDLSDFFYIWTRRALGKDWPHLFGTMLTPKSDELIADPYRHNGSRSMAERYFENGFVRVFEQFREACSPAVPLSLRLTQAS